MSTNKPKAFSVILNYIKHLKSKKQFNVFWNKLTNKDRKLIILLLGANNNEPIPSLSHLKSELFLVKRVYNEEWTYGGIE